MRSGTFGICAVTFCAALSVGDTARVAADEKEDYSKLLQALPKSKHTLAEGIKHAGAKAPESVISAKFELEDGKLSLSVYTAEKGLETDAEHNVLKELAGSPEAAEWKPEVEVFKDIAHVSRASQQLTIMSGARYSLLDILEKVEKDQPGTVFSITPILRDKKAEVVVLVAADGKVVELRYDPMSSIRMKTKK